MKKILILLLTSSSSLMAQLDPLTQLTNKILAPDLVAHDSISVSIDTGSNFFAVSTAVQHYFTNQKIDTLTIYQSGAPSAAYFGQVDSNRTVIKGVDISTPAHDSIDMLIFHQNSLGNDSVVKYYTASGGGSFSLEIDLEMLYNANGDISRIEITVPGAGNVGSWQVYYDQQKPDSLYYDITPAGTGPGFFKYFYDANDPDKLDYIDANEDVNNDGEFDIVQRFLMVTNDSNEVVEIIDLRRNSTTQVLELFGTVRYDIQANSSIGHNEYRHLPMVHLYPNPTSDYIQINHELAGSMYSIYNRSGAKVQSGNIGLDHLSVKKLQPGLYILLIKGEENNYQGRFFKE